MKKRLITCLVSLSFLIGTAQYRELDSLQLALTHSKIDSNRVKLLDAIVNHYKFTIPDSSIYFGQEALTLARKIKFSKGEENKLYQIGILYSKLRN